MVEIKGHTENTWWIVGNNDYSVVRYGEVAVGSIMQSGLSNLQSFTSEVDWANKLLDYNLVITGETSENIVYTGGTWSIV